MAGRAVVTCALLVALLVICDAAPGRIRRRPSLQWLRVGPVPPSEPRQHRVVESFWVEQRLDYLNDSIEGSWKQRYFQNAEYYQAGGPLFIYVNGPSSASGHWISSSFVSELAKQHNALLVELEHRYYGESRPTPDLSSENLQYLSVEQVLEDFLRFIWHINGQFPGLGDAKKVVFGGGYGGNLATWIKGRYHAHANGAVVSGAPLEAQTNNMDYLRIVGNAIKAFDPECYDDIHAASQEFEELLKSESGVSKINEWFGLCEPLDVSKEYDVASLYSVVPSHFSIIAQNNNVSLGGPSDVERECALFKASEGDSPLQRLSRYLGLDSAESCIDPSYERVLDQYRDIEWGDQHHMRQWMYQLCSEFGWSQTTDSRRQPFGNRLNIYYFSDMCPAIFGPEFDYKRQAAGIARINQKYGGGYPSGADAVFSYGSLDPWRDVGVSQQIATVVDLIEIENLSHCQDLNLPSASDVPQLIAARESIAKFVEEWVNNPWN